MANGDNVTNFGTVRAGNALQGTPAPLQMNERGEVFVAQGLPQFAEAARSGAYWSVINTSAIAGLVVRPSTTAAVEIWNGNSILSLVIDRLFAFQLVTTAAANNASIWSAVTTGKAAPSTASLNIRGANGKAYGGGVIVAVGTTVIDSGWFPYGNGTSGPATVTPGNAWEAKLEGRIIVPPTSSLCIHVVSSLTGDTFTCGASWIEANLSNQ